MRQQPSVKPEVDVAIAVGVRLSPPDQPQPICQLRRLVEDDTAALRHASHRQLRAGGTGSLGVPFFDVKNRDVYARLSAKEQIKRTSNHP